MQLFQTLLAGAALIAAVAAERASFTSFPENLKTGDSFTATWIGGDSQAPFDVLLCQGPSDDLHDVETVCSGVSGTSCIFTLPPSLPSGSDYALKLSQGDEVNYTGLFTIIGTHGTPSSAPASTTTSAPSSSSPSGQPTKPVTKPAVTSTSQASMSMTNSANHTTMTTMTTMTSKPSSPTPSMGTATTTSDRNTTMSSPTLTSQSESATLTPSATPTGNAASLTTLSSPLALIMAGLVAFAYLN
ncbi:hypothetical protein TMEN_5804 [Trichophyton mentagrophytes]|uniref:Yeast cell wall synthesis Kre9/Knh1-like N-terminal domain-containing protein n=1 Tax=Trichophyton interdigitale (strain MR816) TaxID=1215338 RepID=A0A059J6C4_TRIIM|nr:hypothetical protein H101_00458 [Trichophyton interdigitale H6]KDB23349.1 hypothetical protein H109_04733 [Trichophyton interdigitale MR816]GBF63182.1 hypothetical protein TMEN_5804 [Trichophyton mentagrophytes]